MPNYVLETFTFEEEIKKSQFISILLPLKTKDEYKDHLKSLMKTYPKATHYCYAYVFDEVRKSNDDGEPSGTAGKPILEVLLKHHLNKVLCVVIRYFGGIKLGAGGLLRAYVSGAVNVISKADIYHQEKRYCYRLVTEYKNIDVLKKYLLTEKIETRDVLYQDKVIYEVLSSRKLDDLINYMQGQIAIELIAEEFALVKGESDE